MINELAVPEWLKDSVSKPEDQKVLNGFLAKVMINAIDLALLTNTAYSAIDFSNIVKRYLNMREP